MDIATTVGILACLLLLFVSISLNGSVLTFVDPASMILVFGGAVAATLMCFPLRNMLRILAVVKKVVLTREQDPVEHVATLVRLAEVARRDGILSLENHLNDGAYDDFMVRGLRMAIDGQDPSVIQAAMEQEVETLIERHGNGKALFETLGKYAPAFGMIGTIVGLILMLRNMDDPAKLGPGMALALITTFYGSFLSNVFFLPVADKLGVRSSEEVSTRLLIIRGVMSIQSGDNPRIVQQKLMAFLDSRQRQRLASEER
ncbi:MAG: motility protein A [Phycisphaerales bacterium]|nr:motility protein A [Phycisphaerales bacterium]